jgi:hypothetical protein
MNEITNLNNDNLFPTRKPLNPGSLTREEVADILHLADAYGMSDAAEAKLLLFFRNRKKAAYAKKKD